MVHSARRCFMVVLIISTLAYSQAGPDSERGMKSYGSFNGGGIDQINVYNGNLFIHAGLFSYPQRGGQLAYPIVIQYNNKNFSYRTQGSGATMQMWAVFGADPGNPGNTLGAGVSVGFEGVPKVVLSDMNTYLSFDGWPVVYNSYSVQTTDGALHQLVNVGNNVMVTTDGSGFRTDASGNLRDSNGNKFGVVAEDANGNQLTALTDTLGRHMPAMPGPVHPADTPAASTASLAACPALNYANQPVTFAYTWNLPTVNGGTLPLVLCYASVYVRTHFFGSLGNGPRFFDLQQNFTMMQSVIYPDGTFWAFQYDAADPANSDSVAYADLLKVTMPTGGTLSYTWAMSTDCASASGPSRAVITRTVDANDGTGGHTWTYAGGTVTDPLGNDTVHTFTGLGGTCSFYETQTQFYQGSHTTGTLLKTVNTDYQFTANPYDSEIISTGTSSQPQSVTNVFPVRVTTILPTGLTSKVEMDYDSSLTYHGPLDGMQYNDGTGTLTNTMPVTNYSGSFGKVKATRAYDWGQGAPGALLRQTASSYMWQSNSNYLANNFINLVSSSTIYDGAGIQLAQTINGYDEYALNSSGISTQHNANPVNGAVRGNKTSVHRWLNGSTVATGACPIAVSNGFLVSHTTYSDTGTVNQVTDACGASAGDADHTTSFAYSSSFAGAYPTSVTNPKGQTASTNYDFSTGLPVSSTDANGQVATTVYDSTWRATQVNSPEGGQVNFCYTDTGGTSCTKAGAPFKVVTTRKLTATQNEVSTTIVDGLGRKTQAQFNSNPSCAAPGSKVDTTYDARGRVATVSNPYCAATDPTYGVTQYAYDSLGRTTRVTHPDGTSATTTYTDPAVLVTDEGNGARSVQRISQSDALGRLKNVCEISSVALTGNGGTPGACGLAIAGAGFLTSYSYDALNNLSSVSQGGFVPRSFQYDSLNRLTSTSNPETGTLSYRYDANGNMVSKTDARNITTTYAYDNLNRLRTKSYSDGITPAANFVYDTCPVGDCPAGVSPVLTVGRIVEAYTSNTRTVYSYDPVGKPLNQWECTPLSCGTSYYALSYAYDAGGNLISESNGFGVTLSSAYDAAGRLTGVTSNVSDATHPASLLSGIQYNPLGLPQSESFGNAVIETMGYDARARLTSLTATSPTATAATAGRGTITVSGTEGSRSSPAAFSSASVTISGSEHAYSQCTRNFGCMNIYDSGKVFINVNGHEYDYFFNGSDTFQDTASTVAQGVVGAIQADGARVVNASCSDGACTNPVITLTAVTAGGAGNSIAFTTGYTYASGIARFATMGPSFTTSPASGSLLGGQDASTIYDNGTVSVTVNGVGTSVAYGSGSTSASVSSALASALSTDGLVNAAASGNVVTITSRTAGANTNYTLVVSSSSSNGFSPPSFTLSGSGPTMIGGSGASVGSVYSFSLSYASNGDILTTNDSANGNWSYGYDDFNRLLTGNKNNGAQTYSYVYDRFGNRWQQNAPQGGNVFLATFSGNNNRVDGYTYDANGNMTSDNLGQTYTYDAENRIVQGSAGVTYIYDAAGQRVEKNVNGVKTDYVYDAGGRAVVELNGAGVVTRHELFAGGKHLGTYTNNTTYFSHADWLGTERVRSDMTGASCETISSLPFGDGQSAAGNCGDPSTRHFTDKERDPETGLDYFGARFYSSSMGRFAAPDWSAGPSTVPYAHLGNPQTLNLYGYIDNNPINGVDLDGHSPFRYMLAGPKDWGESNGIWLTSTDGDLGAGTLTPEEQKQLSVADVTKIIQQAQQSSADPVTAAMQIFNNLGSNVSVTGADLAQALKDTGVKLEGAGADLISHAGSISKSGSTVTIANKADYTIQQNGNTLHVDKTVSFKVGTEGGLPSLNGITGLHADTAKHSGVTINKIAVVMHTFPKERSPVKALAITGSKYGFSDTDYRKIE